MVPRSLVVIGAGIFLFVVDPLANGQILNTRIDPAESSPGPSNQGVVQQAQAPPADGLDDSADVQQTSWFTIPMPKLTIPKIPMPKLTMPEMPAFWTSTDGQSDGTPSPLEPLFAGGKKIAEGSKKAWTGAKEMFGISSSNKTARVPNQAAAKKQPSIWKRMFSPSPPQSDGPRTVAEWMAQPRIDP